MLWIWKWRLEAKKRHENVTKLTLFFFRLKLGVTLTGVTLLARRSEWVTLHMRRRGVRQTPTDDDDDRRRQTHGEQNNTDPLHYCINRPVIKRMVVSLWPPVTLSCLCAVYITSSVNYRSPHSRSCRPFWKHFLLLWPWTVTPRWTSVPYT